MQKKSILLCILGFVIFLITFSSFRMPVTTGAPPGYTGAPNEQTCANAGCHDSNLPNTGSGTTSILFDNGNTEYEPEKKYTVIVSVNQNNINRFGFEFTALSNNDNLNAGTISLTDNFRTQKMAGTNQFAGKEYVTYRYDGTVPVSPGLGQWSFEWTAPPLAEDKGTITFYLATVSADDDGTDAGDLTYTTSLEISPKPLSAENISEKNVFDIFPNPAKDFFYFIYSINKTSFVKIELTDISGKKTETLFIQKQNSGKHCEKIILKNKHTAGLYFLKIEMDKNIFYKKIYLDN